MNHEVTANGPPSGERADLLDERLRLVLEPLRRHGHGNYGGEAVTQLEHALQAAQLARRAGATPELVAAALLHDVGHLLHDLPEAAPDQGIDDVHETLAANWLAPFFRDDVLVPIRHHVPAKRYLCATSPDYFDQLSGPSRTSLELQGGPMTEVECRTFEASPHWAAALDLRRWDDAAKVPGLQTPGLDDFDEVRTALTLALDEARSPA